MLKGSLKYFEYSQHSLQHKAEGPPGGASGIYLIFGLTVFKMCLSKCEWDGCSIQNLFSMPQTCLYS